MKIYFGLGTNLGDKEHNLREAVRLINERIGKVTSLSAFLRTEPWGFTSENTFLNAACCAEISSVPNISEDSSSSDVSDISNVSDVSDISLIFHILRLTQEIERELGRLHKSVNGHYSDRLIDIDLLLAYDDAGNTIEIDTPELRLPHPLMTERDFVMIPLREILPGI